MPEEDPVRRSIARLRQADETRQVVKTRVLLVDMPRLLRDMIARAIEAQDDMQVVGEAPNPSAISTAVAATEPEFVIVGLEHAELPRDCSEFLGSRARPRLLGIEAVDGRAFLYELRPDRVRIGEGSVTPDELVSAVRAAAARASG
jgi:DNA-binding NarL/FixJ family response regulator